MKISSLLSLVGASLVLSPSSHASNAAADTASSTSGKNSSVPTTPAVPATPAIPATSTTPATPAIPAVPAIPGKSVKTTAVDFKGNNGWGNGDQTAPGNSGPNNNAENGPGDPPPGIVKKNASTSAASASEDPIQAEIQRLELAALESKTTAPQGNVVARRVK